MFRWLRDRRGFTLVELIVTMVVLGVTASVGVPALTSYIDDSKINKAVSETQRCVASASALGARKRAAGGDVLQVWAGALGTTRPAVTGPVLLVEGNGEYRLADTPAAGASPADAPAFADVAAKAEMPANSVKGLTMSPNGEVLYLAYQSADGISVVYTGTGSKAMTNVTVNAPTVPVPTIVPTRTPPTTTPEGENVVPTATPDESPSPTPEPTPEYDPHMQVGYPSISSWRRFETAAFLVYGAEEHPAWNSGEYIGDGIRLVAPEKASQLFENNDLGVRFVPNPENPGWNKPLEYGTDYTIGDVALTEVGTYTVTVTALRDVQINGEYSPTLKKGTSSYFKIKLFDYQELPNIPMANGGYVKLHYALPFEFYKIRSTNKQNTNYMIRNGCVVLENDTVYVVNQWGVVIEPYNSMQETIAGAQNIDQAAMLNLNQEVYTKAVHSNVNNKDEWGVTIPKWSMMFQNNSFQVSAYEIAAGTRFDNVQNVTLPVWSYTVYPELHINKVSEQFGQRPLKNAHLALIEQVNGQETVLHNYVTAGSEITVTGLSCDKKYILRETEAPECYKKAEDMPVSLKDGSLTVTMVDPLLLDKNTRGESGKLPIGDIVLFTKASSWKYKLQKNGSADPNEKKLELNSGELYFWNNDYYLMYQDAGKFYNGDPGQWADGYRRGFFVGGNDKYWTTVDLPQDTPDPITYLDQWYPSAYKNDTHIKSDQCMVKLSGSIWNDASLIRESQPAKKGDLVVYRRGEKGNKELYVYVGDEVCKGLVYGLDSDGLMAAGWCKVNQNRYQFLI